jgi:hypothetical protein
MRMSPCYHHKVGLDRALFCFVSFILVHTLAVQSMLIRCASLAAWTSSQPRTRTRARARAKTRTKTRTSLLALHADSYDEANMLEAAGRGGGAATREDAGEAPGRRPGPLHRRLLHRRLVRRPGPAARPGPVAGPPRPPRPTRMINHMLWCLRAVDWIEDTDTRISS